MKSNNEVRVRFAPSPTGYLHIGSVRVAIFNWLFAKHNNGKYLIRVEDTDIQRSKKEYLNSIIDNLNWLSLLPDEPIVYQRQRINEHKKIINKLIEKGLAYPCFCSPAELEKKRDDYVQQGKTYKYDQTCRGKEFSSEDLKKPYAIRFAIPKDYDFIEFDDLIRGKIKFEMKQLDDFVILRRDGNPTYNFVVVLDDIYMKISHIIRGEDHISNTPKQILIYKALNQVIPKFAHVPLILGTAGNKLSKRDAAVSVNEYKKEGFLPDALFNYLVRLGWSYGNQEIFTKNELIKYFTLEHVGKKGAIFDIKKLEWLNGVYIRNLNFDQLMNAIKSLDEDYFVKITKYWSNEQLKELLENYKQRANNILSMVQDIISFFYAPKALDLKLIKKWKNEKTYDLINNFLNFIESLNHFNKDILSNKAKEICKEFNVKLIELAQPLRLALTGKIVSPGIFELMTILSRKDIIERIKFLLKNLENNNK